MGLSAFQRLPAEKRLEAAYRLHAFHVLYNVTLRDERDKATRFAKAIILSARPIPAGKRPLLDFWNKNRVNRGASLRPGAVLPC